MLKLLLVKGFACNATDYGTAHTFKTYNEDDTAFDASNYTAYVKLFDEFGAEVMEEIAGSWTTQNQGIGTFAFTSTKHPAVAGPYYLEVQLEKSGVRLSTERRRVIIFASPAGSRTP